MLVAFSWKGTLHIEAEEFGFDDHPEWSHAYLNISGRFFRDHREQRYPVARLEHFWPCKQIFTLCLKPMLPVASLGPSRFLVEREGTSRNVTSEKPLELAEKVRGHEGYRLLRHALIERFHCHTHANFSTRLPLTCHARA